MPRDKGIYIAVVVLCDLMELPLAHPVAMAKLGCPHKCNRGLREACIGASLYLAHHAHLGEFHSEHIRVPFDGRWDTT